MPIGLKFCIAHELPFPFTLPYLTLCCPSIMCILVCVCLFVSLYGYICLHVIITSVTLPPASFKSPLLFQLELDVLYRSCSSLVLCVSPRCYDRRDCFRRRYCSHCCFLSLICRVVDIHASLCEVKCCVSIL